MYKFEIKPHFPSLAVAKIDGELHFKNFQRIGISVGNPGLTPTLSSNAESTIRLIKESDSIYNFKDFEPILINVGGSDDHMKWGFENSIRIFNYCTRWDNHADVCPDYTFDKWKEAGYSDYEQFCNHIIEAGKIEPNENCAVWRGCVNANRKIRKKLVSVASSKLVDIMDVVSETGNPSDCVLSKNYISIDQQVRKYRYIINANGQGHSGRLKLEMFSGRVIFLIERRYEEWFYPELKPWVHYVPVKQDLSDLLENIEIVKNSPDLEKNIGQQCQDFALSNLRKEHALSRFNNLLSAEKSQLNAVKMFPSGRFVEMDCRDDDYREN